MAVLCAAAAFLNALLMAVFRLVAGALVTALFIRLCPDELDLRRRVSFALAAALSVSGGFVRVCIKHFFPGSQGGVGPEQLYAARPRCSG